MLREKGPIYRFCNELNQMGKLRYEFPEGTNPMKTCIKLSKKMLNKSDSGKAENIIRHSYMKDDLDVTLIASLSEMFCKPSRLNVFVHSKEFKNECIMQEDFMMTRFLISEMPENLRSAIAEPAKVLQI